MCFRVFVVLFLWMFFSTGCLKSKTNNKPTINPSPSFSNKDKETNAIVVDKAFDKEAFKKEVQQKINQINLSEEEKQKQALDVANKVKELRETTHQQLQVLFSNSSLQPEEITNQSIHITDSIELEVRKIISGSYIPQYLNQDMVNKFIYIVVLEEQSQAQKIAQRLMGEYIENQFDKVPVQMEETQQFVEEHSHDVMDRAQTIIGPHTPQSLFEGEIVDPVKKKLKATHSRTELGLLEEPLEKPDDDSTPYQFQFADTELSEEEKNDPLRQPHKYIRLYRRLWHANPFHEQGILARKCGLAAVEVADIKMLTELPREAEIFYKSALAMEKIAIFGVLPKKMERSIYEHCTGKNLITGKVLTDAEKQILLADESYFNDNGNSFSPVEVISAMGVINLQVKTNDGEWPPPMGDFDEDRND